MRKLYLLLAIAGLALPYYFFVTFLLANGLDLRLLFDQLFASDISTFFAVDVIISAVVLLVFVRRESQRYRMRNWWVYALATVAVGPSFALPLFLTSRESQARDE